MPDNFFNEKLYPTYDYNEIHQFVEQNVLTDGWMEKNEFIKTNLYRWNETHFRLGKQGKIPMLTRWHTRVEAQNQSYSRLQATFGILEVIPRTKNCEEIRKSKSIM